MPARNPFSDSEKLARKKKAKRQTAIMHEADEKWQHEQDLEAAWSAVRDVGRSESTLTKGRETFKELKSAISKTGQIQQFSELIASIQRHFDNAELDSLEEERRRDELTILQLINRSDEESLDWKSLCEGIGALGPVLECQSYLRERRGKSPSKSYIAQKYGENYERDKRVIELLESNTSDKEIIEVIRQEFRETEISNRDAIAGIRSKWERHHGVGTVPRRKRGPKPK